MPGRLTGIEFTSAEVTATGALQATPHGLRGTPRKVWLELTEYLGASNVDAVITSKDGINVSATVSPTTTTKYIVHAIL
ncbi:MAG TPA: hypothetical protein ENI23_09105 [bacterium]|nr:hypothetical protein [bacterium]